MAYLLISDVRGDNRERVERFLKRVAHKIQRSVWEFKSLPDLIEAAELVRRGGGKVLAFSRKDEILLWVSKVKGLLKQFAR
jgi:CRISPR/Cas system-associated endoribonuclease Cas2